MLDHARLQARRLDQDRLAALVLRADPHVDRPLDLDADAGQPQAALLGGSFSLLAHSSTGFTSAATAPSSSVR